ncbi:MAG TPA: TIGR04190 family B12-binding domain/radical SAM domain protein [Vicinamibacterales bacterium]|nr:TIGR04190 family B12-binding domain/radical SAM domain protein [Vicinamibacterales bacterium]
MHNPFRLDLVLLHPPAVYDFRTRSAFLGPVADAVPSTPMFEMYPVGMTSIAAFLERNHYNVEIVNLAYRMLQDPRFDAADYLRRLSAPVFGVDLHWLPHVQGALSVLELVKRIHPESRTVVGGLSASYYHEELARYPFVDFVVRGDSTEEPVRQLLQALREGRRLETVENLTWKRPDGTLVVNPLTFVPDNLDYVDVPAYRYLMRSLFKYHSLRNLVPHLDWLRDPITLLLSARGCTENCAVCGGSRSAYRQICARRRPAYRSPEKLAEDVGVIGTFSRAPIFMVHDPRMGGFRRAVRLFELLERMRPPNEMIFELYYPAGDDFFGLVSKSIPTWSVEITLESPDEEVRRRNGKFPWSNAAVEDTIRRALEHGCRKLDVFFMTGLPGQRYEDALAIGDYCEHLLNRFGAGGQLHPFVAPLGPFLDPGSRAFEQSEFGYTTFCRTLEDHRQAFLQDGWQKVLSYQTDSMTRDEIVRATYDIAERLNDLKHRHGLIDDRTFTDVRSRLQMARRIVEASVPAEPPAALAHHRTMFGDDELKWPMEHRFRVGAALVRSLAAGLAQEVRHAAARIFGRYDVASYPRSKVHFG